jgi:molybdate transport system ATP-binding protein
VRLEAAQEVKDSLKAVGIRAHYFNPTAARNRFPVRYAEEMEEPFETIIQFRYEGQKPDSPPVWWRLTKEKKPAQFPAELGISPANILLLYE